MLDHTVFEIKKQAIIDRFGPWVANNIHVANDLYTMGKRIEGDEIKLRRILQVVADATRRPLDTLRILDLACLEGLYALEFARHGAAVVGIEGREAHIEKARFVKDLLSLTNLDLFQDDVRNLSKKKYGEFDVVLCLGILYHLNVPDVFYFLERISEVCRDIVVIDTRVAFGPTISYMYKETRYWGHTIREHRPSDTPEVKLKRYWASLDNITSFHLSRTSLFCFLGRLGFTSVYECYIPPEPTKPIDRITLLAIKGSRQKIINAPLMDDIPTDGSPDDFASHRIERAYGKVFRLSRLLLPEKLRILLKRLGPLANLFRPYQPK